MFLIYKWKKYQVNGTSLKIENSIKTKGLLALLIVFHHVSYYSDSFILKEFNYWGNIICGVFFFLSGYGLMKSKYLKGDIYFCSFLPTHLWKLFSTLIFVMLLFLTSLALSNKLGKYLSLVDCLHGRTFVPNTWFVYAMTYLYIVFYMSFGKIKKRFTSYSILLGLTLLYILIVKQNGFGSYWYSSVLAFAVGVLVSDMESKLSIGSLLFNICIWGINFILIMVAIYSLYVSPITYAPFLCAFYPLLFYLILRLFEIKHCAFLAFLGKISYELYVVHGIFIYYLHDKLRDYKLLIPVLLLSVISAYIINRIVSSIKIKK